MLCQRLRAGAPATGRAPSVEVRAIAPIAVDEEICISYADSVGDVTARRKVLVYRSSSSTAHANVYAGGDDADAVVRHRGRRRGEGDGAGSVQRPDGAPRLRALCPGSESKAETLSPDGDQAGNLRRRAFGPGFGGERGDRRIYPQ